MVFVLEVGRSSWPRRRGGRVGLEGAVALAPELEPLVEDVPPDALPEVDDHPRHLARKSKKESIQNRKARGSLNALCQI